MILRKVTRHIYLYLFGSLRVIKPGLHIINSHYVTPGFSLDKDVDIFEEFIKGLICSVDFVGLDTAVSSNLREVEAIERPLVSLTFDDGFEECYSVIAPILEKYDIRACFFINANYIESDLFYQKRFNSRIHLNSKRPMNWAQVKELHKQGHLIGSHTLDHYNLSSLSRRDIEDQIRINKHVLERKLDYVCDYFAWPYGRLEDFPDDALRIAEKYHKYIFSSANNKEYFSLDGRVVNRRHLEPFWPNSHIKYFLSFSKR